MPDFSLARERMVDRQIAGRGIKDPRVIAAMRIVPREFFVADDLARLAYDDSPLPIQAGQTISQPYIVATMIEAAAIEPSGKVLEIGAGSGYAAAVIGRIAMRVIAIERHEELAALAASRMAQLGYDNVRVLTGDGSVGCPAEAPFNAILVAASGSHVPDALRQQLEIGGTLVMPVGEPDAVQHLVKFTRVGEEEFEEDDLGAVRFVPLIGAEGWQPQGGAAPSTLAGELAAALEPLPEIDGDGFAEAIDRFADARIVLLGEASHGTAEFYAARAAFTRRLIEKHGFNIVAVEADWPDAAWIDRYVRNRPSREGESEPPFQRFPIWMWRNQEVDGFVRWLRGHNAPLEPQARTGFYGLDLYNLEGSIRAVIDYLDDVDPDAAAVARERYGCLWPWSADPARYGRLAVTEGYARCKGPVVAMLRELNQRRLEYAEQDGEEWLDATANARLVKNAEAYYRVMYEGAAESWNLRDTHMFETLCQLLDARGDQAKAVVWAHNSHIGNAAFTEMGRERDELNLGQLVKERFGDQARLIGFGTHEGEVAAASDWDAPMEIMTVRPGLADSVEALCHESGVGSFLLDLREGEHDRLRSRLMEPRLERFIGVIYRPDTERWSHYAEVILPRQFDAWIWFDRTHAVTPLGPEVGRGASGDETWPFGL